MPEDLAGWELMYTITRPSMKNKRDLITTFLHWNILKKKTSCLGVGDKKTQSDVIISEQLPADWNKDDLHILRYKHGDDLYTLYGIECSGTALFNFVRDSDSNVYTLAINIDETVTSLDGAIREIIPNYVNLMQKIRKNLLETIINKLMINAETQTPELGVLSCRGSSFRRSYDSDLDFDHNYNRGFGYEGLYPGFGSIFSDERRNPRPEFFLPRHSRFPKVFLPNALYDVCYFNPRLDAFS